jgi:hypothetical protein
VNGFPLGEGAEWLPWALLAGLFVLLGVLLQRRITRWLSALRMRRMRKAGREGEERAQRWLLRNGFRIDSDQARRECQILVDGTPDTFQVRADFLVRDPRGRTAVVEVKTGESASPRSSATRRQILEYAAVYGVRDVYLFDGTQEKLMHLEFVGTPPTSAPRGGAACAKAWFIGVLMGLGAAAVAPLFL